MPRKTELSGSSVTQPAGGRATNSEYAPVPATTRVRIIEAARQLILARAASEAWQTELRQALSELIHTEGPAGLAYCAQLTAVSQRYLSDLLSGNKPLSDKIINRILKKRE